MFYFESSVFFCQVDSFRAFKDYQKNGRCVRLLAVPEYQFSQASVESELGVQVISIEVSYWEFYRLAYGNGRVPAKSVRDKIDILDEDVEERSKWYRLEVDWNAPHRHGYAYPTFGDDDPRFFELLSCSAAIEKLSLAPAPLVENKLLVVGERPEGVMFNNNESNWTLSAFHVGQGMCSIVSNGNEAILLDVGAGTPVTRGLYQKNKIDNDLAKVIEGVSFIDIVLSHADQDHWRILAWDANLRKKIRHIFVPEGAKSLAFKDPSIRMDIKEVNRLTFSLSAGSRIEVYRSKPSRNDDNGHCLISTFENKGKKALIAGDYVYDRFRTDANSDVKALVNEEFDAVVVPHHGDDESAFGIFKARDGAVAFFSAGDHKGFGHPTATSRDNHILANYREICDNLCGDIKVVELI